MITANMIDSKLNISLDPRVGISNITRCPCKKFELTLSSKALLWQHAKLGKYDHVPSLVAGKDLFYNNHQRQYLFWVDNKPGYWMVSKA